MGSFFMGFLLVSSMLYLHAGKVCLANQPVAWQILCAVLDMGGAT
jgi:hypothetical protein